MAGAHVGNFEIVGYMLNSKMKRVNALIYAGETAEMQKNRSKIFNNNNINLIPVLNDMSHFFTINAALQNGEIVSMPCDRNHGSTKSVECNFLNGKADFPVGAFALAASFEVDALAIFAIKISAKKYKIFLKPICDNKICDNQTLQIANRTIANRKLQIANLANSYVKELENIVKQYPEQWFNFYEFWK